MASGAIAIRCTPTNMTTPIDYCAPICCPSVSIRPGNIIISSRSSFINKHRRCKAIRVRTCKMYYCTTSNMCCGIMSSNPCMRRNRRNIMVNYTLAVDLRQRSQPGKKSVGSKPMTPSPDNQLGALTCESHCASWGGGGIWSLLTRFHHAIVLWVIGPQAAE